jgi:hypothetical protein
MLSRRKWSSASSKPAGWLLLTRLVGEPPEFDKEVKNIGRHLPTQLQVAGKFGARIKGNE